MQVTRSIYFYIKRLALIIGLIIIVFLAFSKTNLSFSFSHSLYNKIDYILYKTGFRIKNIEIIGKKHSNIDINKILNQHISESSSIFDIRLLAIKNKLIIDPWIEGVLVQRIIPSTLRIIIQEKVPSAIWQKKGIFNVVDKNGEIISSLVPETCKNLPYIIGKDANINAEIILSLVSYYPDIKATIGSYHYRNSRRWDLITKKNQIIKLPESNINEALKQLSYIYQNDLKKDTYSIIDLRDNKRYYITKKNTI